MIFDEFWVRSHYLPRGDRMAGLVSAREIRRIHPVRPSLDMSELVGLAGRQERCLSSPG